MRAFLATPEPCPISEASPHAPQASRRYSTLPAASAQEAGHHAPAFREHVRTIRRSVQNVSQVALLHRLQEGRCFYCFAPITAKRHRPGRADGCTVDHVIPRSFGGHFHGNIVLACSACNHAKADRVPTHLELAACRQLWSAMLIINPGAKPTGTRPACNPT